MRERERECFYASATRTNHWVLIVQPQARRGVANGLSMSFGSFFKAVGPAGGGAM